MMEYYPASPSFGRPISIDLGNLPDVTRFTSKVNQLSQLVDACTAELEPLGRFLGRTVDARNTPAAIALLPADLLPTHGGETISKLRQWLDQSFANPSTQALVISGQDLFQYWSGVNPEKLSKAEAIGLSQLLARFGFGIEPDLALGGTAPTLKSHLALFRLPETDVPPPKELSAQYADSLLLLRLAIAVASGTESPSPLEQKYLTAQVERWTFLEPAERLRLNAHLQMAMREKPLLRTLKTRIEAIAPDQRRPIAQFAIAVASADGQLAPKEVQHLEKTYTLLGLEPQSLYSDIHDLSTSDRPFQPASEPVTVQSASAKTGYKIPSASTSGKHKKPELTLDMNLVQSKLEESKAISNLLSEIFVDEQERVHHVHHATPDEKAKRQSTTPRTKNTEKASSSSQPKASKSTSKSKSKSKSPAKSEPISAETVASSNIEIAGLDASHSELLMTLAKQPLWQRGELEAIATRLNLMLDGALEVINEVAFDLCDEALIEGDNPIEVNADVLRELMA